MTIQLTATEARTMSETFNDGVAPEHVITESMAQEWTIPEMVVFVRYDRVDDLTVTPVYRPLEKSDLLADWLDLTNEAKFSPHHTYVFFARYHTTYKSQREYIGPVLCEAGETDKAWAAVKVMEVAL